ncbi:hypothetical protein C8R46DRAFT_1227981 [Mycena filopes]|nr:hypothetical protein C8R46DRAFT_1227981 [Mycena filopes]
MPSLPIDVLENIVDSSSGSMQLLSALGLTCRTLTARTRVHLFHTMHSGSPPGPHPENPDSARSTRAYPTRCDTFFALCRRNPDLSLHVNTLEISQGVWQRMENALWPHHTQSILPVVHSLVNLKRFAFYTEGLNVTAHLSIGPLQDAVSFILAKNDMEWIRLADLRFFPATQLFDIFAKTAQLRVLSLVNVGFYKTDSRIENIPGYRPVQIDTLAVGFEVQRIMEEPFIRIALRHACPVFDMQSLRCLQIQVYHGPGDMDRVREWLSIARSIPELEIRIVPANKALHLKCKQFWKRFTIHHFEHTKNVEMPRLKTISFRVRDHDGIDKIAAVVGVIALAESLVDISIHFTSARGPLSFIAEEPWRRVDAAFSTTGVFPSLDSVHVVFGRNSHVIPDLDSTLKTVMPNTAAMLHVVEAL